MKLIDLLKESEILPDGIKANYFRGMDKKEMSKAVRAGHLTDLSQEPMSKDWEVIELSMSQNGYEGDPEQYVDELVPWNPKTGVNVTTDFSNAVGYGDYVLALSIEGPAVDFTSTHTLVKSPSDAKVIGVYDTKARKWLAVKK